MVRFLHLLYLALAHVALATSVPKRSVGYNKIALFGDSLSDNGMLAQPFMSILW